MKKFLIILLCILASCVSKHSDTKKEDKVHPKKPAIKDTMSKKPVAKTMPIIMLEADLIEKISNKVIKNALIKYDMLGDYGLKKGDKFTAVLKREKWFIKKADGTMIPITIKTMRDLMSMPEIQEELNSATKITVEKRLSKLAKNTLIKFNLLGNYGLKKGDKFSVVLRGHEGFIKRADGTMTRINEIEKIMAEVMDSEMGGSNSHNYKKTAVVIKNALLKYNLLGDYGLTPGDSYEVVLKGKKAFIKRANGSMIPITEKTMKELRERKLIE